MDKLQIREKEIFETLKKIKQFKFVIIGGYAVNAYTLPRFSVDCDIVVKDKKEDDKIEKILFELGYLKENFNENNLYRGDFRRYEKCLEDNFRVSIDILIKEIIDRQTNVVFLSTWIFDNSELKILKGKTIIEELKICIINLDALFVMKFISGRSTDIRDIFMLSPNIKDKKWIKQEIMKKHDFNERFLKIKKEITSKQFKDGLQGIYGYIEDKTFNKYKKAILELEK